MDLVADLLAFIDAAPTPYHAVTEAIRRLGAAGFRPLLESDPWRLSPGDRAYVSRADGSLIALRIGAESPVRTGFRLIGAHTDSPNLRVKPLPDVSAHGYRQLAMEPYGGLLLHTWLDRDLSLAGRVSVRTPTGARAVLVDFRRPLLHLPSLAIHLHRELGSEGLKLNPQQHAVPLVGLDEGGADLTTLLAGELARHGAPGHGGAGVEPRDILAFDLMAYDTQPGCLVGARGEFIHAARLDNLASCHAALAVLAAVSAGAPPAATCGIVLYDHEEVGSRSAQGAAGPFLVETLARIVDACGGAEPQGLARAAARSLLVSADMAHAVHPNYPDKHEAGHRPVIGRGPVIKVNANQSYATDAETAGRFRALCQACGIEPQHYVVRSDLPCGSTIGPVTATRAGIRVVDVGNPMLAMHSCREVAGAADVEPMVRVLRCFFERD
jgi:aspartyl aminopeptidase